jgi:hypothetical protein
MTLIPRYALPVAALMGIEKGTSLACQGIVQLSAPASMASMIWFVTRV